MNFSYWEYEQLDFSQSAVILGGGITGISCAIELKVKNPRRNVVVVDRSMPPSGASTKNGGFVCFGSISEIQDDLRSMSLDQISTITKMRWNGAKRLMSRLNDEELGYRHSGGYEYFSKDNFPSVDMIKQCNELMESATGVNSYFTIATQKRYPGFNSKCIEMRSEGKIQPFLMMKNLYRKAAQLGINFVTIKVDSVDLEARILRIANSHTPMPYDELFIATNGFANRLLKIENIYPARNIVLMTEEIDHLEEMGTCHFDSGYYYFRSHGKRVLLGGARNLAPKEETTDQFGLNPKIQNELLRFLKEEMGLDAKPSIWWSGILGMGSSKAPILKSLNQHTHIGVRLGGMGVAIGSELGRQLADLSFKD